MTSNRRSVSSAGEQRNQFRDALFPELHRGDAPNAVPADVRSMLYGLTKMPCVPGEPDRWTVKAGYTLTAQYAGAANYHTAERILRAARHNRWIELPCPVDCDDPDSCSMADGHWPGRGRHGAATIVLRIPERTDRLSWKKPPSQLEAAYKLTHQRAERRSALPAQQSESSISHQTIPTVHQSESTDENPDQQSESSVEQSESSVEQSESSDEPLVIPGQSECAPGTGTGSTYVGKTPVPVKEDTRPEALRPPDPPTSAPDALDHPADPQPRLRPGHGSSMLEADRLPPAAHLPAGETATIPVREKSAPVRRFPEYDQLAAWISQARRGRLSAGELDHAASRLHGVRGLHVQGCGHCQSPSGPCERFQYLTRLQIQMEPFTTADAAAPGPGRP